MGECVKLLFEWKIYFKWDNFVVKECLESWMVFNFLFVEWILWIILWNIFEYNYILIDGLMDG